MKVYNAIGRLKYSDGFWIVLDCPQSIVNYYAWWVRRLTWKSVSTPLHGAHVTVLAGKHEKPQNFDAWKKYQGKKLEFQYSPSLYSDGKYYWLQVDCPPLAGIRRELGLRPMPKWPYHLTVCYTDEQSGAWTPAYKFAEIK